uniref:Aldehyde-activating protein n=1 Tax=Heterorhabditis bacteriophora TaxID=37862 RepID=A0A1I7WE66_HETBA
MTNLIRLTINECIMAAGCSKEKATHRGQRVTIINNLGCHTICADRKLSEVIRSPEYHLCTSRQFVSIHNYHNFCFTCFSRQSQMVDVQQMSKVILQS